MTKRGQLVVISIITLVIAVAIALSYPKIAESYVSGKLSLKVASARDIALLIDTIYAYPYDMKAEYDIDLSKFIVEISQGTVKVYGTSFVSLDSNNKIQGYDPTFAEYSFLPSEENINFVLNKPKKIIFDKKDGRLTINQNENI